MGILLSTGNEFTSVEGDETGLNSEGLPVFEDDGSSINSDALKDGSILIDKEGSSLGHNDEVIVNRGDVNSPGSLVAPSQGIEEGILQNGIAGSKHNCECIVLSVSARSGSNCANNSSGS